MRWTLFLVMVGCAAEPAGTPSTEATIDVQVTLTASIDSVTLDGAAVPIVPYGQGRVVDPTLVFPSYVDALAAPPQQLVFLSQGQPMFVGQVQAGACQDVCARLQCADRSKFTSEHVELTVRDFSPGEYDAAKCVGPSGGLAATP